jgi:NADH:ubiquinone oxidoreductase subunit 6 (subunit J)
MQAKINWFGLAGGVTTIVVIIVSLFSPWWQLTVGENLAKANVSPLNTNFDLLGTTFTIPLIWALNVVSILSLVASGIVMIVYSIAPTKSYSKHLLGFAYKKPLFTLLFFVAVLFALTLLIQAILHFNVPLAGSTTSTLPTQFTEGTTISVLLSAEFQWPFWLAAVAAGLCIAARIYHKRITTTQKPATTPTTTAPPTVATT